MVDALCLIEKIRRQGGRETYKLFARHFEVGVSWNIPGSRRDIVELFNLLQLFVLGETDECRYQPFDCLYLFTTHCNGVSLCYQKSQCEFLGVY